MSGSITRFWRRRRWPWRFARWAERDLLLLKIVIGLATFFIALSIAAKRMDEKTKTGGLGAWRGGGGGNFVRLRGAAANLHRARSGDGALDSPADSLRKKALGLGVAAIFALWINTHGGVLAGLLLLFAAAGAATAQNVLKTFAPDFIGARIEKGPPRKIILWLWFSAILSAVALLANPYGIELPRWLVASVLWLRPQITEWNPAPFDWNHAAFLSQSLLAAISILFSRKPWQLLGTGDCRRAGGAGAALDPQHAALLHRRPRVHPAPPRRRAGPVPKPF